MVETCETQDTCNISFKQWCSQKACLAGPKPSQTFAVPCHLGCKRSRYPNRTVKYSIKAISKHNLLCK